MSAPRSASLSAGLGVPAFRCLPLLLFPLSIIGEAETQIALLDTIGVRALLLLGAPENDLQLQIPGCCRCCASVSTCLWVHPPQ